MSALMRAAGLVVDRDRRGDLLCNALAVGWESIVAC